MTVWWKEDGSGQREQSIACSLTIQGAFNILLTDKISEKSGFELTLEATVPVTPLWQQPCFGMAAITP